MIERIDHIGIAVRSITWSQLAGYGAHPNGDEFARYLAWKLDHSPCAAKLIADPRTAATDIDEVVRNIWLHQQPGYIEIHQDMVDRDIEALAGLREEPVHARLAKAHRSSRVNVGASPQR